MDFTSQEFGTNLTTLTVAIPLSQLVSKRLEELGGKTPYWLALEARFVPAHMYGILKGDRAFPEKYIPAIVKALGWKVDSPEGIELKKANDVVRAQLKRGGRETIGDLQQQVNRLEKQITKLEAMAASQKGQLATLRDQRESEAAQLRDAHRQISELTQLILTLTNQLSTRVADGGIDRR